MIKRFKPQRYYMLEYGAKPLFLSCNDVKPITKKNGYLWAIFKSYDFKFSIKKVKVWDIDGMYTRLSKGYWIESYGNGHGVFASDGFFKSYNQAKAMLPHVIENYKSQYHYWLTDDDKLICYARGRIEKEESILYVK